MYLFDGIKSNCCGCKVCSSICPTGCISFDQDEETFLYPKRNESKCVECHLCDSVCPFTTELSRHNPISLKVGIHKNKDVVYHSSSGGAFSAICECLMLRGYKIYGVKLDDKFKCVFDDSDNANGYQSFRKSKYIQADIKNVYHQIKQDLFDDRNVLFTGLPCQNAALKLFLDKIHINKANLITIDILCHGVVSQGIFDGYLEELSQQEGCDVVDFVFRNKHEIHDIVNSRSIEVKFSDGNIKHFGINESTYLRGYYARLFYRPSCYSCLFANRKRVGDLTLADAWGIEKRYSEWNSLSGVSLIMANTTKGDELLKEISKTKMNLKDIELTWAVACNDTLREPTHMHPKREKFFDIWPKSGFSYAVNRYSYPPLSRRIVNRIIRISKRIFQ